MFDLSEALRTINGTVEWTSSALWALGAVKAQAEHGEVCRLHATLDWFAATSCLVE